MGGGGRHLGEGLEVFRVSLVSTDLSMNLSYWNLERGLEIMVKASVKREVVGGLGGWGISS